ncbi:MAG TPA: ABC transporter permease [Polyangiaceae bacterium]|nr:ABC transporter permease [Polyangiaceae bacterium]
MFSVRWHKLIGDVRAEAGRAAVMIVAIAVSLVAVGAVLGAYAILTREIAVNYLGTRPASATLELSNGVDAALLQELRQGSIVSEAEARDVILARARVGDEWRPLLLFVVDDFDDLRLNTFRRESGAFPPPEGTMLIERTAVGMLAAAEGDAVLVKTPSGSPVSVRISGLVHDPGLAPAWQEREGYGYVTRATLARLGEAPVLHELRIEARDRPRDIASAERAALEIAGWLGARGHRVHEIRVPPPAEHPHQRQMTTVLILMLAFSGLALVLSATLVATSLAAMLARQVREIGVMKTVGARTSQLVAMYVVLLLAVGAVSLVLAVPLAVVGARFFSSAAATMLNLTLTCSTLPWWVFATQVAAGLVVPVVVGSIPIARATRMTVRETIDQYGVSPDTVRARFAALPMPLRNVLRRPARLGLTLGLLAAGGAMFMTAINVSASWEKNLAKIGETRFYDLEVRFRAAEPATVAARVARVPGVTHVEAWGYSPSAIARPGQIDVVRTYPDRGHGSLIMLAPPPRTTLVRFPLRSGRWLVPGDSGAVVLNHSAAAQVPNARLGDRVTLSLDGAPTSWVLSGIVEEIGSPAVAYVDTESFSRAAGTGTGARMLRLATSARSAGERIAILRRVEDALAEAGASVEAGIPLAELRTAIGDHIVILIRSLLAMAAIMAIVGALGLASTMGSSVVERTREFGILSTLGATPKRLKRLVLAESFFIAGPSYALAWVLSVPLTALVDGLVGNLGFLAALPLVLSHTAALEWLVVVMTVSFFATLVPATRAGALTVHDALARL